MRRRLVVTLAAGGDGHVGFQTAQGCRLCNIDMTSCAFLSVWFAAMAKLQRDSLRRIHPNVGLCCELVTAGVIFAYRLLRLPMAVETRGMTQRRQLESIRSGYYSIGPTCRGSGGCGGARLMTDFAVVVVFCFLIRKGNGSAKAGTHELWTLDS